MYEILPLTADRHHEAGLALADAFMADPLFKFIAPVEAERRAWLPHIGWETVRLTAEYPQNRIAVDGEGRIAGVMCAGPYPPNKFKDAMMQLRLTLRPRPWVPKFRYLKRVFAYEKIWARMHYKGEHLFVYMIGVSPEHQRRGLGRRLMEALIEESGEARKPIYLETQTPGNVVFYKSLGFTVTEEHAPFAEGPRTWGLIRGGSGIK